MSDSFQIAERLEPRRLLSDVVAMGPEFSVNPGDPNGSKGPAAAMNARGDSVIVWTGVAGQRYDAAGNAVGGRFQVSTQGPYAGTYSAVAMDAAGDFVVTWASFGVDGDAYGVYARRYNSAGAPQGDEFQVNANTIGDQFFPSVGMDDNGNFVITWWSVGQDGDFGGIYARRYNSYGASQSGEFRINTYTTGQQVYPRIAMSPNGNFVVAWDNYGADVITAQRYNASGVKQGSEFVVNTYTTGDQYDCRVATDSTGNFVIMWLGEGPGGVNGSYAQRFNAAGTKQGGQFPIDGSDISMDRAGNFVAVGSSADALHAQRYDATGVPQGAELTVSSQPDTWLDTVAMDPTGDFVVAWDISSRPAPAAPDAYARRFALVPEVNASSFLFDTAPQKLSFTFDHDVTPSLGSDDLLVQNLTTGDTISSQDFSLTYNASTNVATFSDTSGILPDGNYRATLLSAGINTPQGVSMAADDSFDFFVLAGDANHDRKVDVTDLGILASNWQGTAQTFAKGDFNYDGVVDVADLGILASNWQNSLPAAPPPAASSRAILVARPLPLQNYMAETRPRDITLLQDVLGVPPAVGV